MGTRPAWRRTVALAMIGSAVLSPGTSSPAAPRAAETPGPGYITILFGRTQWVTGRACIALPRTVDLGAMADAMTARGLVGTGGVVVDRTPDTGLRCYNHYDLQPGWDWMHRMQHERGWSFISQSQSYLRMPLLSYDDQVAQSCGSLPAFRAHHIHHANALFSYPANEWTDAIQADPVSGCFSYGRRYLSNAPNVRSEMAPPWFAFATSVNGGFCSDARLPCHTVAGTGPQPLNGYSSPNAIAQALQVGPDEWFVVQFYRFVKGTYQNDTFGWDCRSVDWRAHWTSNDELYCWNDVRRILNAAADATAGGAVSAGPHDVALAWGRVPPSPPPPQTPEKSLPFSGPFDGFARVPP
jgi:hypothetical protein